MSDVASRAWRWISMAHGVVIIFGSLAAGLLSWFVLARLAEAARGGDVAPSALPASALAHPWRVVYLAGPALVCGILCVLARRMQWLWFLLGMAILTTLVCGVLYCLIEVVSEYYEYQPL
jgi:hypothetical protein